MAEKQSNWSRHTLTTLMITLILGAYGFTAVSFLNANTDKSQMIKRTDDNREYISELKNHVTAINSGIDHLKEKFDSMEEQRKEDMKEIKEQRKEDMEEIRNIFIRLVPTP